MTVPNAFLGNQALLGTVPEATYGTTPSPGTLAAADQRLCVREREHQEARQYHPARRTARHALSRRRRLARRALPRRRATRARAQPGRFSLVAALYPRGGSLGHDVCPGRDAAQLQPGDHAGAKNFLYAGCSVSRAVISGSKGGMLKLVLDVVGQSETTSAPGSPAWPTISADVTGPYIFSGDTLLTINSAARPIAEFELTVDNHLIADRFLNSITIVSAASYDRTVSLPCALRGTRPIRTCTTRACRVTPARRSHFRPAGTACRVRWASCRRRPKVPRQPGAAKTC